MLLRLPPEILVQILQELDIKDLFSCQRTGKYLDHLIRESVVLQYNVALDAAKAQDNPCLSLTVAEKLGVIKSSEDAWAFLRPQFTTSIPVTHNQSGVYDLTGGVYLLSNLTRTALHYLKLPSREGDEAVWKVLRSDKSIIDIGLSIFEHDLIVNVVTEPHLNVGSPTTYDIEIQFIEFSTGNPHPLAREHRIFVMNTEWEKPSIVIEIVGENLVLILSHTNGWRPDNRIFIYEWKTGLLKVSFEAPYQSYSGLIFLSESLILLPNTRTNGLDIFRIPTKPTLLSLRPILTLNLPTLSPGRVLGGISCRAEPNPISPSSIPHMKQRSQDGGYFSPNRPFSPNSEHALCIFDLRILVLQLVMDAGGALNMQFGFRHRLTFVVHRHALVDLVHMYAKEEEEGESEIVETAPASPPSTADIIPEPVPEGPLADGVGEDDLGPSLENSRSLNLVPWSEWGPAVTRWFNSDNVSTHWITTTAGQRCVRMASDPPPGDGYHFVVLDFNPVNVRKMRLWLKEQRATVVDDDVWEDFMHIEPETQVTTSVDLNTEGEEHVDHEDPPDVVIDPTLQPTPESEETDMILTDANSEGNSAGSPMVLDDMDEDEDEDMINSDEFLYFPTSNRVQVVTQPERVEPTDAFSEPVIGKLPYVVSASQGKHVYDGVLLDEERVIGIITGAADNIERIDVHYFG
ncbi:hypothetical protein M413DRAFT_448215 [Hebeloma cylindrosporum]|uniref:F-box domain-containing protein n=1 Tax=Hebeloma cylindrosporum TaxID=76867 RepID=A0A0C3C244_HEBCY|nr:hypothetical protein M413DRAFT_448215 [Hebeloma cylindrosporum h7]